MSEEAVKIMEPQVELEPELKTMMDAGVFYGRTQRKTHPRMKQFIATNRSGIEVIDLSATKTQLETALAFIKEKVRNGARLLLVGTQPAAQEDILSIAQEFDIPAVTTRWLGGTLTNFKVISRRIEYFKKLKADFVAGNFQKYTKKEQLMIQREKDRLNELLGTIGNMAVCPDLVIMVDIALHMTALREARNLKIPIVAFINTDSDPDLVDYPVVGNNKAKSSINWFLNAVRGAIKEGRAQMVVKKTEEAKKENNEGSDTQTA